MGEWEGRNDSSKDSVRVKSTKGNKWESSEWERSKCVLDPSQMQALKGRNTNRMWVKPHPKESRKEGESLNRTVRSQLIQCPSQMQALKGPCWGIRTEWDKKRMAVEPHPRIKNAQPMRAV